MSRHRQKNTSQHNIQDISKNTDTPDHSLTNYLNDQFIIKHPRTLLGDKRTSSQLECNIPHRKLLEPNKSATAVPGAHSYSKLEGRPPRRRSIHIPKIDTSLIDYLESSNVNLLERMALEERSSRYSGDDMTARTPSIKESPHFSLSFQSDISVGRKKKAPVGLCDINALISDLKSNTNFRFYYLIWAVPVWSEFYNPYCLKLVPYQEVNKNNFLTISTEGVTHHFEGNMTFTPLKDWERDFKIYCKLIKIKTFANFIMWKIFYVWHKNIAWHKVMSARQALSKAILYLNDTLRRALLDVMDLCWKVCKISFVDLSVTEKNELQDFSNNQLTLKGKIVVRLLEFRELIKEIVNAACHETLMKIGYSADDSNLRIPDHLVGTIAMRGLKTSRDGKYRMTYVDQALKKQTCSRLASFIHLVDFMVQTVFHNMLKTTIIELKNILFLHLKFLPSNEVIESADLCTVLEAQRTTPPKLPLFVSKLILNYDELKLEPSCSEFLDAFEKIMADFESIILNIPGFLSDTFFDPFTEPLVCGKQEERLCGLGPSLEYVIRGDRDILSMKQQIIQCLLDNFKCIHLYMEHFQFIHSFYVEDTNLDTTVITEETDLEKLRALLVKYHSEKDSIMNVIENQSLGIIYLKIISFKESALPTPSALLEIVETTLPRIGREKISALTEEAEYAYDYLEMEPKSTQHYVQYLEFLDNVTERVDEMDNELEYCKDLYDLVEEYLIAVSPDDTNAYFLFGDKLTSLHNIVDKLQNERAKIIEKFNEQISKDISALIEEVANIRDEALQPWLVDIVTNPELAQTTLTNLHEQLTECLKKAANFKENQKKFKVEVTRFDILDEVMADVKLRQLLWESIENWEKYVENWTKNEFSTLSPEELGQTTARFMKYVVQFEKGLPENQIVPKLRGKVEKIKDKLPVITTLRNPNLKARHWMAIENILNTRFSPDVTITLEMLENLGVFDLPTELQEISGQASSEASLEALLHKVEESWRALELIVLPHKDSKDVFILGSTEEVQTALDESNININTISSSRHVGPIKSRVDDWIKQLDLFAKTLDAWSECQTNWLYLESIFSAPDIQRQLPLESKMFLQVDKSWKEIMRRTAKNALAMPACTYPGLLETLQNNNNLLGQVNKCLEAYLETKRVAFPRFYFLSNDELLEILAQTRNPHAVQPHLRKCFDAISKLQFGTKQVLPEGAVEGDENVVMETVLTTDIVAMISPEEEYVLLGKGLRARGNVEDWLGKVEDAMFLCLRRQMKEALLDYMRRPRTEWVLYHPAQITLTVSQIMWCQEVFRAIESQNPTDLKYIEQECYSDLNDLAVMVRGDLPDLRREILRSLITIDVHARDIVTSLVQNNVRSSTTFEWLKQLRFYWEKDIDNCVARMSNACYIYGYEYLGASSRLVVTPLTDKCFLCLMGALELDLGGAPAGPAGTGKTESTKDLAKSLAIQCVVFNCSDGLDYKMMGRFFSGLAQSGAWCCFDEFNRIDIEVLSVIAQQLITIRNAKVAKLSRFMFEGREIKLVKTCAAFITMNPGYAGRTELPDNLKSLFRPMAMMVPDYGLISEVTLYSEGFESSQGLAQKMVNLYKLCSEQLSQQGHYDFGMRAVKSVLVMAGALKRDNLDKPENVVLMRALKDSNLPKFIKEDAKLFEGILGDLFPGVVLPEPDYGALHSAVNDVILEKGLQPEPCTFLKVTQLYETMIVRHGVMTVGMTGGGKTAVLNILKGALTRLHSLGVEGRYNRPVNVYTMNPKSVSIGELYGEVNLLTMEWRDGLLGIFVRLAVQCTEEEHQWVVCDGPVDAVWIENMNTVLDDNKMLCLANSERIKLTKWVHMVFEVQDLAQASLATISRCGMVLIDPEELKWLPYVKSWIQNIEKRTHIQVDYVPFIMELFTKYVENGLVFIKKQCVCPISQVDISKATMMCCLFESIIGEPGLLEKTLDRSRTRSVLCQVFIFSYIWSVGGNLQDASREKFEIFVHEQFDDNPDAQLPPGSDLWDLYINTAQRRLEPWVRIVPNFKYDPAIPFFEMLVPTIDTVRFAYVMEKLVAVNQPVLFTGVTGVGKSVVTKSVLNKLGSSASWVTATINFSAQTTSLRTQEILESKLERKKKNLLGAPAGKRLLFFVDDVNMPKLEKYGAQPPIELLRQYLDFKGLFDREKMFWKEIQDVVMTVACAPPGGGRNPLTQRFVRHFAILLLPSPSELTLKVIFKAIVRGFLSDFSRSIYDLSDLLVSAAVEVYNRVSVDLLPTPAKSHYIFNLRDLSKCVQGMLQADASSMRESNEILRLFYHECLRVFHDRLVNVADKTYFYQLLKEVCQRTFSTPIIMLPDTPLIHTPPMLLFGDFMSQAAKEDRPYDEIKDITKLKGILQDYLMDFNLTSPKEMKLIFFMDAIEHICRLARLLRAERGNGLLVGVGGMGKQSLTKLGAHLNGYKCSQIELTSTYDYNSFHEDLRKMYFTAGALNEDTVFLFTDTQIVVEEFLEDINNILNSGEVPGLFESDEYEKVIIACRPGAKEAGVQESNRDGIFDYFISRVRSKLHLVICMSPVGSAFRRRCRMFPSLVNCCTIDWFSEWPEEALISVAQDSLKDISRSDLLDNMSRMCFTIHESVGDMTLRYFEEMRRYYYVTPSSYLELLKQYRNLLEKKTQQTTQMRDRIQNGLHKLHITNELVANMKVDLIKLEPQLKIKSEVTSNLLQQLTRDKAKVDEERQIVLSEEMVAKARAADAQVLSDQAQAELDLALPAMDAATKALDSLNKNDINELRVFNKPPNLVKFVMEAVCLLLGAKTDWASAKQLLGDSNFLKRLQEYNKNNIPESLLKKLKEYIQHPEFLPDLVATQSKVCRSMCMWVRAIDSYAVIFREVEPKRKKAEIANEEVSQIRADLRQKQQKLADVEAQITALEAKYDESMAEKADLEDRRTLSKARLGRAGRLTMALGDEQVRWDQSVKALGEQLVNLLGDVLIAAACMAYLGAFTSSYREELTGLWTKQLSELKIPASPLFSMISVLADPYEIRMWNSFGLPRDNISTENAIMVSQGGRWPLMIDPQEQANQWIRRMEANNNLNIVKLTDSNFMRTLDMGIRIGMPVLIEEIGETLDPTLGSIMTKQTFVQGGRVMVRLGDSDVEYDANFRLYVTTKLANPHYLPEICIQVTLINFTVTPSGLEDQLLADVVRLERPDLEAQRTELIVKINNDKGQLKAIEDKILKLLFASDDSKILDDEELIETLNESKETSAIIGARVIESEATEELISSAREKYRIVATRGSCLFFVVADLPNIDPMYQFSLKYFNQIFNGVIVSSPPASELSQRLQILIEEITRTVYTTVSRGLFERHKLVYSFMLCTSIFRNSGRISEPEWNFLLRGAPAGAVTDLPKKPNILTLSENQWAATHFLAENFPNFTSLPKECTHKIVVTVGDFEQVIELDPSKKIVSSTDWNEKLTIFERMMLLKALKEEKLVFGITEYVRTQLGQTFVESPLVTLQLLYQDMSNVIPLVFVLSTGSDPVGAFLRFAMDTGNNDRIQSTSLGQGQGPIAEKMIDIGKKKGDWVFLQNCHLASSWMLQMEKIILNIQENPRDVHTDFRLFLSSMPSKQFPISVLQNSVKVTNEPPKGLRANLKRAFNEITEDYFQGHALYSKWRKMIFGICMFHAVIQERKKFGPLGWNILYEFNDSDRECALQNLELFCKESHYIPWDALEYTTGEITYGGRVTDSWDQRTLKTILKGFFSPSILDEGYTYSPSGTYYCPNLVTLAQFREFIEGLPIIEEPEIFGMHENANIAFQTKETAGVIVTIMEVQPRESGGAEGKSSDEIVYELADMIKERIIVKINTDEAHPSLLRFDSRGCMPSLTTVLFQETDRFNRMLRVIHSSLKDLQLAIKGLVVMSDQLEEVYKSFINNQVPKSWSDVAYPSLKTLGSWIKDLELRLDFITIWVKWGQPSSFWLSGLFFPQGFMTGCLQTHARKYGVPIDELKVDFTVGKIYLDQENIEKIHKESGKEDERAYMGLTTPPDGVLVHGLFLDAGCFDTNTGLLSEPKPGEINPPLPVMQLMPVTKVDTSRLRYHAPLYKTSVRAGVLSTTGHSTNYVVTVLLPTSQPQSHWIMRGTALLTQITD